MVQLIQITKDELKALITECVAEALKNNHIKPEPENFLTAKDVAKKFQVTSETITDWNKAGKLTGFYIGGRLFFLESEVIKAAKTLTVKRKGIKQPKRYTPWNEKEHGRHTDSAVECHIKKSVGAGVDIPQDLIELERERYKLNKQINECQEIPHN